MKKRNLKSLRLNKKLISDLREDVIKGGISSPQGCSGSQNDSQCGLSCGICPPPKRDNA
jgi:hypothetical protein